MLLLVLLLGCAPDAERREPPDDLHPVARELPREGYPVCDGRQIEMVVTGKVWTPEGAPNPGVPLGLHEHLMQPQLRMARSDDDGTYRVVLQEPAWIEVMGWWHGPPAKCAGLPEHYRMEVPEGARASVTLADVSFIAPPMCDFSLELDGPSDPTLPLQVWVRTPRTEVLAERLPGPFDVDILAPCDSTALLVLGSGLASEPRDPASTCEAPTGWTCLDPDERVVPLKMRAAEELRGRVQGVDGSPIVGATVSANPGHALTGADGTFTLTLPPSIRPDVRIDAEGLLPARFEGTAPVQGTLDSDAVWQVVLPPARRVEVRCAGFTDDRCPAPPTCRAPDAPRTQAHPCEAHGDYGVVCRCPVGEALLGYPGLDTRLPAGAEVGQVDWRGHGGGVVASTEPGCVVLASRQIGWRDAWSGPRWHAQAVRADEEGVLNFEHLTAGSWRLDGVSCDAGPRAVRVAAGTEQELGEL